jgi:hypothetical protein
VHFGNIYVRQAAHAHEFFHACSKEAICRANLHTGITMAVIPGKRSATRNPGIFNGSRIKSGMTFPPGIGTVFTPPIFSHKAALTC